MPRSRTIVGLMVGVSLIVAGFSVTTTVRGGNPSAKTSSTTSASPGHARLMGLEFDNLAETSSIKPPLRATGGFAAKTGDEADPEFTIIRPILENRTPSEQVETDRDSGLGGFPSRRSARPKAIIDPIGAREIVVEAEVTSPPQRTEVKMRPRSRAEHVANTGDPPLPTFKSQRGSLIPPTDQPIGQTADGKQPLTTEDHALLPTSTTGGARPRSPHQAVGTSAAPYAPIYQPANQDADAMPLIGPYHRRGYQVGPENLLAPLTNLDELDELPPTFRPWWDAELSEPMRQTEHPQEVDVDRLVVGALQFAPRVMSLRADPQVRATYLAEYCADFDWRAFLETRVDDLNDPVGNTLTTGGPRRFKDLNLSTKGGLRRRTESGGEFEISQRAGWEDTNSIFFIPKTQGTARLQMNYTQPLLNGAGEAYNRSRIVLARIDANRSFDETAAELQDHLLKVAEAYWELYRTRAIFLQRDKVLAGAEDILETLGARQEVDALPRQVLRARAAVASRRSEIIRSAASIRNAESHLRLLVNDPAWQEAGGVELIPTESPLNTHVALTLSGATQTALQNRPDVSHAIRDLRAAGLRLGVAKQDLLPKLDLVLSAYVAGLNGESAIGRSLGDQFGKGRPGYSTGLVFEVPLGNRAASARAERREWELNKAMNDFRTIVETGLTDVEISVREVETSYREMLSRYQSLLAAEHEAAYLDDRWRTLPGDDRGTTLLLEDLLTAQSRVAEAEADFVTSQVAYTVALIRSQRATGTLLKAE